MNKIRLLLIYTALPLFCAMIFGSPAYGQGGGVTPKRELCPVWLPTKTTIR